MVTPASLATSQKANGASATDRSLRIAYIDPQSYHGLAKYDLGYLRGLLDAGFDGDVLFYCSSLLDERVPDRVARRPIFTYNHKRTRAAKALSYLRSMLNLTREALAAPADLYHFQWFKLPSIDYLFVLVLRKLVRARVVMTAHNVVPHGEEGRRHRSLGRLFRAVDGIIAHNETAAREIVERFSVEAGRISVLRHGPLEIGARGRARHRERVESFAANRDLRFLFIGRGSRYKGLDLLLEAWTRFVAAGPPGKPGLIVIGAVDDDLKDQAANAARREASSLLLIDEHVPEADLYYAMRCADVAVLPHRRVSQSGVLLSVLAQRMPVLVSSLPGLTEPFESAPVGWRFDGSVEGLVERLGFLAGHPEKVAEVRANEQAWRAVEEAYAWRSIGDRAREIYQRLLVLNTNSTHPNTERSSRLSFRRSSRRR